jgi:hypothetical protein
VSYKGLDCVSFGMVAQAAGAVTSSCSPGTHATAVQQTIAIRARLQTRGAQADCLEVPSII